MLDLDLIEYVYQTGTKNARLLLGVSNGVLIKMCFGETPIPEWVRTLMASAELVDDEAATERPAAVAGAKAGPLKHLEMGERRMLIREWQLRTRCYDDKAAAYGLGLAAPTFRLAVYGKATPSVMRRIVGELETLRAADAEAAAAWSGSIYDQEGMLTSYRHAVIGNPPGAPLDKFEAPAKVRKVAVLLDREAGKAFVRFLAMRSGLPLGELRDIWRAEERRNRAAGVGGAVRRQMEEQRRAALNGADATEGS